MKRLLCLCAVLAALASVAAEKHKRAEQIPEYSYTIFQGPGEWTLAAGINNLGDTVGPYLSDYDNAWHGFLFDHLNTFTTLPDAPGAAWTTPCGINDLGQIVGWYAVGTTTDWTAHAFLLDNGVYTTIDPPGSTFAYAYGINNKGEIVGQSDVVPAFLLSNGTYTTIGPPGAFGVSISAINDLGQIVGTYLSPDGDECPGFLFSGETYTTLPIPGIVQLTGINNKGQIVGSTVLKALGPPMPFLYTNSNSQFRFPGNQTITGINDSGQVSGHYPAESFIATPLLNPTPILP